MRTDRRTNGRTDPTKVINVHKTRWKYPSFFWIGSSAFLTVMWQTCKNHCRDIWSVFAFSWILLWPYILRSIGPTALGRYYRRSGYGSCIGTGSPCQTIQSRQRSASVSMNHEYQPWLARPSFGCVLHTVTTSAREEATFRCSSLTSSLHSVHEGMACSSVLQPTMHRLRAQVLACFSIKPSDGSRNHTARQGCLSSGPETSQKGGVRQIDTSDSGLHNPDHIGNRSPFFKSIHFQFVHIPYLQF